ncbi:MAG: MBL fold metallo-hydrolase [Deltaproteobacteria bacterium]|nr:MAG: MBL fold metallo-hydrolase [Deltaproteobacteria bacterium]
MKIKFWGVRGSIPCPGPDTVKYGGNTPCIELRFNDINRQIIIDAGSGIRELGNHMMANDLSKGPIDTELFLTHTHSDHIMGFPFFSPIYLKDTKLKIYGPVSFEDDTLKDIIGNQMSYRYFPVRQIELASKIDYIELKEGPVTTKDDNISVTAKFLNHPVLCLGYRFKYQDKVVCTLYDSEPFQNIFTIDPQDPSYDETMAHEGEETAQMQNELLENFLKNADLVIRDAQYTQEEYQASKKGWGHTSMEYAIESSKKAGVKQLALFHHEPLYSDKKLDELTEKFYSHNTTGNMEIFFAKEGMEIIL